MASTGTRSLIRSGQFFKLNSALETGAADGDFTFARYAEWLARKPAFAHPGTTPEPSGEVLPPPAMRPAQARPPLRSPRGQKHEAPVTDDGALVLTGEEEDLSAVLAELEKD